ncbi:organic hydroperoxide resistance protein OhrB [Variibacter gotjawalensis]|uniref:Organic hydroperoxide resistance protein OhrB n=1 Tax=Variibacter gotjawalensis TaxID=1333996 RepID=A0A0S3PRR6_9BRAD|nr:organic hydroperoxide resistance protein [Variibacter gotjawalensis]NIK48957.1 Ohr subfamily peroxiredoxin [Variibacter gotjawalensis]RZS50813.1 Ohr subfamily peroxiredoxin [Variibacter gotjawalensis]BAT58647.1 organic hydroperoxide resistance protein OhrB [Variibacter gotjawalensis]
MAYVTKATSKGGRAGRAHLEGNALSLAMGLPKEMGGNGEGHNPEQLFAIGYAACFNQAVLALAKKHGLDGQSAEVSCTVTIDKDETSFGLKADMSLKIPGAEKDKVQALLEDAHKICPYSKATRGNIPVTLTVV